MTPHHKMMTAHYQPMKELEKLLTHIPSFNILVYDSNEKQSLKQMQILKVMRW